jgi:hypothetical protein
VRAGGGFGGAARKVGFWAGSPLLPYAGPSSARCATSFPGRKLDSKTAGAKRVRRLTIHPTKQATRPLSTKPDGNYARRLIAASVKEGELPEPASCLLRRQVKAVLPEPVNFGF